MLEKVFLNFAPCFHVLAITPGSIRLIGSTPSTGRVEIFYNNQWGTICDDSWDINDANVVCRQLGFPGLASRAFRGAHYGQGSGPIWIHQVACSGSESTLYDCSYRGWGNTGCIHSQDAGVQCSYGSASVRLVGGGDNEGRVEVYFNGKWEQCATTSGTSKMPRWCVVSLIFPTHSLPVLVQNLVRDLVPSGWIMLVAKDQRLQYMTARIWDGKYMTAVMVRMLVLFVRLSRVKISHDKML